MVKVVSCLSLSYFPVTGADPGIGWPWILQQSIQMDLWFSLHFNLIVELSAEPCACCVSHQHVQRSA